MTSRHIFLVIYNYEFFIIISCTALLAGFKQMKMGILHPISNMIQISVTSNRTKIWFNCTLIKLVQTIGRENYIGIKVFLCLLTYKRSSQL